ncbi:hypothetical protein Bca4012_087428 [Brassica carinata]|nr:unnamed protein product [Brassica napus]VDD48933.1 unnamed protein product [Brassica oleracea]
MIGKHRTLLLVSTHAEDEIVPFVTHSKLKPEEISGINSVFAEPGMLAPTGLFISGIKYMIIQGELNVVIRGKKCYFLLYIVGSWWCYNKEDHPSLGLFYDEPMTPGQYNMVVERLDDYLTESGL